MAELVDAQVSGTCDRFGRGSSSLLQGTTKKPPLRVVFLWCVKGKVLELPEGSLTTRAGRREYAGGVAIRTVERAMRQHG